MKHMYFFFQVGSYAYMVIFTDYVNTFPGITDLFSSTTYMFLLFDVDDAGGDVQVSGIDLYSTELGIWLVPITRNF